LFESIPPPSVSARLRSAAIPPIAAYLFAHIFYSTYPYVAAWLPPALTRVVDVVTAAGAIGGVVLIVRVLLGERVRGVAIGWLILALVAVWLCAQTFLAVAFPWL
jgi:hypothetical protein